MVLFEARTIQPQMGSVECCTQYSRPFSLISSSDNDLRMCVWTCSDPTLCLLRYGTCSASSGHDLDSTSRDLVQTARDGDEISRAENEIAFRGTAARLISELTERDLKMSTHPQIVVARPNSASCSASSASSASAAAAIFSLAVRMVCASARVFDKLGFLKQMSRESALPTCPSHRIM